MAVIMRDALAPNLLQTLENTPVIVHAEELRQIKDAVAWAEREGLRLILAGRQDDVVPWLTRLETLLDAQLRL